MSDAMAIGDPEIMLQTFADAMPNKPFDEYDIALMNARGETVHPASPGGRRGKREAVDLFRLLMLVCFRSRATDIHLEPKNEFYQVRLRVDGNMVEVARFDKQMGVRVSALVKVLSDIDISQRNIIQEGHFASRVPGRRVDYRVSFAPSVFGQKLVIRVLDAAVAPVYTRDLQLPGWMLEKIDRAIRLDAGMVLVAGPTGSGKTTTLYSLLRSMDARHRNVVTIEDPVEMQLENVTQLPVDESEGKSFLSLLRSILRQDPDVILVGEIRDQETARTAMQAAITGHLVFSSIHTRDTVGTVFRLLDLGVEPYLLAQGMHMVLAQRLVRQLCQFCKKSAPATPDQIERSGLPPGKLKQVFRPVGCAKCLGTGYFGRRAFFELLSTTDEFRDMIIRSPSMQEVQAALAKTQFQRLADTGYELVAQGLVEFDEIEKVVGK
jgi:general secretion pathway protein E